MVTGGLDCMLILWDFKKEKVSAILPTLTNLQFCSVKVGLVFGGFVNAGKSWIIGCMSYLASALVRS